MYFLLYRNISIGGIETLILREACWINEHTESRSMVLCFELSEQMRSSFEASGIDYKLLASWSVNEISKELRSAQTVEMIKYFSFEDYLKFVIHDPDLFENYKTMYHCVHPLNACILKANNWIRKSFWKALSNVTRYMVETKRFRFMDDESINQTLGYYGLDVKESYKEDYIRIPYQIKDLAFKNMDGSGNRNVLAIARAEFPFKGYLLGLIDVIPDVLDRYSNTFITIISSGDGLSRLENKIKQLPEKYKNHIGLYNDKKPEDLDAYYQEADIFIGMGTTVLEAANYGIPVIMAKPYTEEFISKSTKDYIDYLNELLTDNNIGIIYKEQINKEKLLELEKDYTIMSLVKMENNLYSEEELNNYIDLMKEHFYVDGIINCPYIEGNNIVDTLILIPKTELINV